MLAKEGFGKIDKERIINEYQEIEYSNTNNKSVLGSMNDLTFHYKYLILSEGGIHNNAIPNIINKLNRMPMGALEYRFPIEVLKANIR
ncbi:MAG: hypothetical protein U9Q91_02300 [Candidatus Marinimicrobia bacterium]|nr:hypothetical protein [Candidatus Neomarinimicrobiota bacterium]